MKALMRGAAALLAIAAMATSATVSAQDKKTLDTERDKVGYLIGLDVGRSIEPVGPDLDWVAFEKAIRNAFDGGKPLLDEAQAKSVGEALMQRIAARKGQAPAGAQPPALAKDKVGYLVGSDVGRSLAPIKAEFDLATLLQGARTVLANGKSLLAEAEATALRESFSKRMQAKMAAEASVAAEKNSAEGAAFLAKNKQVKGVFTTPSGLQYMILRQGTGPRPKPSEQGQGELPRHPARRQRVRQFLRSRPAGRVRAQPGDPGLDRRRRHDAGRRQVPFLDSRQPGLWREGPAQHRPQCHPGVRCRTAAGPAVTGDAVVRACGNRIFS